DTDRQALAGLGRQVGEEGVEVVVAWAPAGVRALWSECRGGRYFHTYPDLEWLEVLPDGEIAWTSTASRPSPTWATTAPAREPAAAAPPTPTTAMFGRPPMTETEEEDEDEVHVLVPLDTDALAVLDEHPGVAAWQAEYRRVGGVDELIVFVAPAGVDRLGPL